MQQWSKFQLAMLALCSFNIFSTPLLITNGVILSPEESDVKSIIKSEEDFFVVTGKGPRKVNKHDVSRSLKKMDNEQLTTFLNQGHGVIKAYQFTNGDYKLDMHVRGNGGGALGAAVGLVAGTAVVQGLAHGTIWTIAACTGPFVFFVGYGLEAACAPAIHTATIYAAAVGGMTGAVATGPI